MYIFVTMETISKLDSPYTLPHAHNIYVYMNIYSSMYIDRYLHVYRG